jgi:hypothetical protein
VTLGSAFEAWFASAGISPAHKTIARAGWAAHKRHVRSPQKWRSHPSVRRRFKRWQKSANDKSKVGANYHCRRWDEIEEALVMDAGKSVTELAKLLGRTRHAIKSKRKMLNKLNNADDQRPAGRRISQ